MNLMALSRFRILLAIAILAALVALVALPVFSSHTCVAGSDDYDQCIAQSAPPEDESDTSQVPPSAGTWIPVLGED